jgi:putative transposase
MPRGARIAPANTLFHVLNRANARSLIFEKDPDYAAFEKVLAQTLANIPIRLFAYCIMPNHWHMILQPTTDTQLGQFMQRLTVTHVRRWHEHRHTTGRGHLYQGAYKSFPIQRDSHLLKVVRYIQRNPLRANLVTRAEDWRYSSLWIEHNGDPDQQKMLTPLPVDLPADWLRIVNRPQNPAEEQALRTSIIRGRPFGATDWAAKTARKLNLTHTFRDRGRPKIKNNEPKKDRK